MATKLVVGQTVKLSTGTAMITKIDPGKKIDLIVLHLLSGAWPDSSLTLLTDLGCFPGGWVSLSGADAEVYCIMD
jgi:hypothetical protein